MDWKLNKEQIAEVAAMFTELCEQITDKEETPTEKVAKVTVKRKRTLNTL